MNTPLQKLVLRQAIELTKSVSSQYHSIAYDHKFNELAFKDGTKESALAADLRELHTLVSALLEESKITAPVGA